MAVSLITNLQKRTKAVTAMVLHIGIFTNAKSISSISLYKTQYVSFALCPEGTQKVTSSLLW